MTCGAMHEDREGLFFCYNFRELDNSEEILNHAKSRSYFVAEYLVGHPIYGEFHMIQLRPPTRVYRKFLQSKFSSMYTAKELDIVAADSKQRQYFVLRKHPKLVKEQANKFGVDPELLQELDSNIDPKEEFFDYPVIDPLEFKMRQNESK
jgi:transcriptional regulator of NAD metabolism